MSKKEQGFSKWLFSFFSNYLWLGLMIVFIAVLLDQHFPVKIYLVAVIIKLCEAIGISIVIASIFTYASGTSQFVDKIQKLLQDIVVSRNFLGNIDSSSKREALNALIKPSTEEKKIYSNIEDYLDTYITSTMEVTQKCVRSNYIINSRAYICQENKRVAVASKISYRLYPTKDGYSDIQLGFSDSEKLSICENIIVNTPHGARKCHPSKELNFEDKILDGGPIRLATVVLSSYSKQCSHLDIEINMTEYGADHWILLPFIAMQPTDGFKHHLRCEDGLTINEYTTFVHGAQFYTDRPSDKEITTSCNEWINEGTGIALLISKLHSINLVDEENERETKKTGKKA